ncbi:uncharacterized protein LODBEIA_P54020 [Lodderomyces beijingensis]|uniref:ER membrane protein complex subunit 2 n=1 Tax=Lodderomyces beijingensis TaxID=1775926 RepID=A0ABP0ZU41_9ASCO
MSAVEPSLVKQKLLHIAASGAFAKFTPEQLHHTTRQLTDYLLHNETKLDSIELFQLFELEFYLSILTHHDIEAKNILDRLRDQFGSDATSQRIRLLQSIYYESQGQLKHAGDILSADPDELKLSRRLTTFARYDSTPEKYINNLNFYLNLQPADILSWCELSHQYAQLGIYDRALYCLKRVVVLQPTAYNIFYKIGLMNYYLFLQAERELKENEQQRKDKVIELMSILIDARDNYMYSLEINDQYDKSWVGLWSLVQPRFAFNLKSRKISESSKAIKHYLQQVDVLRPIVKSKITELGIESE